MTNKEYKCDYWVGCGKELHWCDGHVIWTTRSDPIILCDECFKNLVGSHVPLGWYHRNFQKGQPGRYKGKSVLDELIEYVRSGDWVSWSCGRSTDYEDEVDVDGSVEYLVGRIRELKSKVEKGGL